MMKKDNAKKNNTLIVRIALFAVMLLFVITAVFSGMINVYAEDFKAAVELPTSVFDIGEEFAVEFSIYGLVSGKSSSGTITAEYKGLGFLQFEAAPGFEIRPNKQQGIITIEFSTTGGFVTGADGKATICMANCYTNEEASTVITVHASLQQSGSEVFTTPDSVFSLKRKPVPTPTPTPRPTPTPTPDPDITIDPDSTPVVTDTPTPSPTPTMVPTDVPTPTPTPTLIADETPSQTDQSGIETPYYTSENNTYAPGPTSANNPGPTAGNKANTDSSISIGAVVFWSLVTLVAGIWIGIGIGASIWKKQSIFVTDEEKKILGKK